MEDPDTKPKRFPPVLVISGLFSLAIVAGTVCFLAWVFYLVVVTLSDTIVKITSQPPWLAALEVVAVIVVGPVVTGFLRFGSDYRRSDQNKGEGS